MISTTFPYHKKRLEVLGREMAYVEVGSGDPIVFLHGNPTSSYLWRNVIPYLEHAGRCIAPDLIGMGDSDKLPNGGPDSYTFIEHRRYLDALLDQLSVHERVTLVVHDWGSALGFDWALRHPDAVKSIAYMEALVKPYTWDEFPEAARPLFKAFRTPAGEALFLEQNTFIEVNLPNTILRKLTEEEWDHYRRPFREAGEARRPMLTWSRQLPFDGEPADVAEIMTAYGEWLARSSVPKLFIRSDPGQMVPGHLAFCLSWPEQTVVTVPGRHYPQEDSPDEVGRALAAWLQNIK